MSTTEDAETVQRYLATQNAHKKINALKLLSLKKNPQKVVPVFLGPSDIHKNKEAHNKKKTSFRRRHKMFQTVPSVQAKHHFETRNLGIRTPPPSFLAP